MTAAPLQLQIDAPAAHLVLNRPEKRNALTEAMWFALPDLLAEAEANPAVRVLIVRGEGGSFAAGADIGEFEAVYATTERADAYSRAIAAALDALAAFPKPTIAQIDGPCVGGGCALALACDLRFAADTARFGVTPAKLGLAYPFNDMRRLIAAVGPSAAKDLLFTARLVDAAEAQAMGLINWVGPSKAVSARVADYVAMIARTSAHTAAVSKAMTARIETGQAEDCDQTRQMFLDAFHGPDFAEGYRAFLDKRAPRFPGGAD